jgi:ribosomal protein S18 acetylase RimI-like enzyme
VTRVSTTLGKTMADSTPVSLDAIPIGLDDPDWAQDICNWNWEPEDTYVRDMIQVDIPERVRYRNCRIWSFRDPNNEVVGFGTMDVWTDWSELSGDSRQHTYIPLLGVNKERRKPGYGTFIVNYLIEEATVTVSELGEQCQDYLFLDVYADRTKAISIYEHSGFEKAVPNSLCDQGDNRPYFVMYRNVSVAA